MGCERKISLCLTNRAEVKKLVPERVSPVTSLKMRLRIADQEHHWFLVHLSLLANYPRSLKHTHDPPRTILAFPPLLITDQFGFCGATALHMAWLRHRKASLL